MTLGIVAIGILAYVAVFAHHLVVSAATRRERALRMAKLEREIQLMDAALKNLEPPS
jgi:hypothetical protein